MPCNQRLYVSDASAVLECRLEQEVGLGANSLIMAGIIAVHIGDEFIIDGRVDSRKMQNLARLG